LRVGHSLRSGAKGQTFLVKDKPEGPILTRRQKRGNFTTGDENYKKRRLDRRGSYKSTWRKADRGRQIKARDEGAGTGSHLEAKPRRGAS